MLTNIQIEDLAKRMDIPLAFVGFKDTLPTKLYYNKSYVINLDDEFDEDGNENEGSHWTCFQVNKYPNGKAMGIYFDSYNAPPPEIVAKRVKDNFDIKLPHTTKNIQSLLGDACGFFCLAFLHYINAYSGRTMHLYTDVEAFLELFDDLDKSIDFKKNEYILKMFFQSSDPQKRKEIEVISQDTDRITGGDTDRINLPVPLQPDATSSQWVTMDNCVEFRYI